ncbi:MAG: hypothetical protein AABZ74_06215 [Cyanobacteriota bacterium]
MRLISIFAYSLSILFIYMSLWIAEGSYLNLMAFWDISAFVVILAGLCASLINFKFSEIFYAIKDSLSKNKTEDFKIRYSLDIIILETMGNYVITASLILFIMNLILCLSAFDSPEQLGSSIAISFIVLLYGLIFKFIIFSPLLVSLQKKNTSL